MKQKIVQLIERHSENSASLARLTEFLQSEATNEYAEGAGTNYCSQTLHILQVRQKHLISKNIPVAGIDGLIKNLRTMDEATNIKGYAFKSDNELGVIYFDVDENEFFGFLLLPSPPVPRS